ncbi:MAG: hypothetical protein F6K39_30910 [Okeania sp. SIO3B3]|nr:hypothetical protein [Okeania sp. SIO3B3]
MITGELALNYSHPSFTPNWRSPNDFIADHSESSNSNLNPFRSQSL